MPYLVTSIAVVTFLAQAPNEAEKLFRAMEQKILNAESISASCTATGLVARGEMSGKVTWIVAKDHKANLNLERSAGGDKAVRHVVSNGKSVAQRDRDGKYHELAVSPKDVVGTANAMMIDLGTYNPMFMWPSKLEGKSVFSRHDFKLGADEKIAKKTARVLEYSLKDANGTMKCKIWLDSETVLPQSNLEDCSVRVSLT